MSIFAKNKTRRSYPSMDIFNVSKFGSLVNFLQSWNRNRSVLLHQTHFSFLCYPRCQFITWQKKKEKNGERGCEVIIRRRRLIEGRLLFEEIRYLRKVGEFVQTFVWWKWVGRGGGNGPPTIGRSKISGPDLRVEQYFRSLRTYLLYT